MTNIKTFKELKEEVMLPSYKNVLDMVIEVLVRDRYKENGGRNCSRDRETIKSAEKLVVDWWNRETNKSDMTLSEHRLGYILVRQLKREIFNETIKAL